MENAEACAAGCSFSGCTFLGLLGFAGLLGSCAAGTMGSSAAGLGFAALAFFFLGLLGSAADLSLAGTNFSRVLRAFCRGAQQSTGRQCESAYALRVVNSGRVAIVPWYGPALMV